MIGTIEGPGPKNNPAVVHLYEEAGHPEIRQDAVPWCAAFVGAMLKRAGIKGSGSLAARSYEAWGQPLKAPVFGCIAVKKRKGGGWLGHVGFCVAANAREVFLLAGNQHDEICVAPFPRSQFTAFRWPANLPVPKDLSKLPTTIAGAKAGASEA